MNATVLPLRELTRRAVEALVQALGPVEAVRFLEFISPGQGDYTAERGALLPDLTLDDLLRQARELDTQRRDTSTG